MFAASSDMTVCPSSEVSQSSDSAPRARTCVERSKASHCESGLNDGYVVVVRVGTFGTRSRGFVNVGGDAASVTSVTQRSDVV
jgi:hypothetical protein